MDINNETNIRLGKLPNMFRLTQNIIKHYTNQLKELKYKNYTTSIYNSYSLFYEHINILQCNLQNWKSRLKQYKNESNKILIDLSNTIFQGIITL